MTTQRTNYILAIDPGEQHCGMALFRPCAQSPANVGWECFSAYEKTPDDACDDLAGLLLDNALEVVIYETFRLYPDKAQEQAYSEMETAQQIGVIKWLVTLSKRHSGRQNRDMSRDVELVGQPADIMVATAAILRAEGVKSVAKRNRAGGHAFAAELHGWHYLIKAGRCGITTS